MDPKIKRQTRKVRAQRVRARIKRVMHNHPRLSVYKSNTRLIAQIIDDKTGKTLAYATTTDKDVKGATPMEKANALGATLAKKAQEAGVKDVVFDRGGFAYTGKIKVFADSARETGLNF